MEEYSIYCTEEQTSKALELGAPIELRSEYYKPTENDFKLENPIACSSFTNGYHYAKCPTTEQMIAWLDSQGWVVEYSRLYHGNPLWAIFVDDVQVVGKYYETRTDAIRAAIDFALNKLSNN